MDTLPPSDRRFAALADAVWAERTLVEHLAFKLKELELVLTADLRRYVGRCLDEVDAAADHLDEAAQRRQLALDELGSELAPAGRPVTLATLAERAPEPWATVFADHQDHLRSLVAEVHATAATNARLTTATLAELGGDLASLSGTTLASLARLDEVPATRRPRLRLVSGSAEVTAAPA